MIQLIYYSVAAPSLTKEDVLSILEVSRQNNSKNKITGCMLFYNDAFIQILEGDQELIKDLYVKIEQDDRHSNIRLVFSDDTEERLFNDWSMAFYDLDNNNEINYDKLNFRKDFIAISEKNEQKGFASELFHDIAQQILNE